MDIPDDRRRRSPSPAAAPPPPKPFIPFSLGNGSLRNHAVYRQCMKNHAAAMGGHAVDGCGEFMPSNVTDPADPSSLACAACGCHRNFHRRILHPDPIAATALGDVRGYRSSATPPRNQMLVPFGGALRRGPLAAPPRKRARTKFTDEQKLRMKELSEKLGWRMQKGDGATVEIACREMGVSMGVFKVWMHNNKHIFVGGSSSRRAGGGGGGGGGRDNSQALSDKTDDEAGGAATGLAAGSPTTPS